MLTPKLFGKLTYYKVPAKCMLWGMIYAPCSYIFFSGPKLPFKLYKSMMVSLPLLNEIILFRGFRGQDQPNNSTPFNAMVRLNNISMKWTIYNQTFKYGMHSHVAFLIPERW